MKKIYHCLLFCNFLVLSYPMDTNKDLKRADPALTSALAALDSLDRRELGSCKTINNGKLSSHSGEKMKNK